MDKMTVAGIEVSASTLILALEGNGHRSTIQSFENTPAGRQALLKSVSRHPTTVRVCMESTGLYGLDLALLLHAHSAIELMVANPRSVRHFAQAMMQRSKTDPLDAHLLSQYALRMPFQRWQPPALAARQLGAITRRIHALTEHSTMEKNRLHAARVTDTTPRIIVREIERSLKQQQRSIARLTREALKLVAAEASLAERFQWLLATPGIAQTSALQLLGELVLLSQDYNVRQWVAYAGLDPREYTSGSSVHKRVRISKVGNRHLRRALYMPALVAARRQPQFRVFYQRLVACGKPKKAALVAVMRKLLHAIYGMFHNGQTFDANRLFAPQPVLVACMSTQKTTCYSRENLTAIC